MPKEYGEYDFVWLAAAYVAASVVGHGATGIYFCACI